MEPPIRCQSVLIRVLPLFCFPPLQLFSRPYPPHPSKGGNLALSALSFWASYYNYPGGAALKHLHSLEDPESGGVSVHLDWNVAQTGASRFLELSSVWKYSKEEDLEPGGARTLDFTHLLLGVDASTGAFDLSPYHHTHSVVKVGPGPCFSSYSPVFGCLFFCPRRNTFRRGL